MEKLKRKERLFLDGTVETVLFDGEFEWIIQICRYGKKKCFVCELPPNLIIKKGEVVNGWICSDFETAKNFVNILVEDRNKSGIP